MKLSVVIATYNRRDTLARTLPTVLDQDFPAEQHEVIVVVDGSTDGTLGLLRAIRPDRRLRVVEQSNRGPGAARNVGIRLARGELILFLDDDDVCERSLLSCHVAAHTGDCARAVFGPRLMSPEAPRTLAAEWTRRQTDLHLDRLAREGAPRLENDAFVDPNTSVPRVALEAVGGFDERFMRQAETADLGQRLWKAGVRFTFEPRAVTHNLFVKTADAMVRTDARWAGRNDALLAGAHPDYRARSVLGMLAEGGVGARLARQVATRSPLSPDPPLALACRLADAALDVGPVREAGLRLLWARMGVESYRAGREAIGGWGPLRRAFGQRLPVLLYHRVAPRSSGGDGALTVSPGQLERDVAWLARRGYSGIRPSEWLAWVRGEGGLPERPVLLTFDDAYADLAEHAFPILRRHGFGAAVFVVTGQVGGTNAWDAGRGLPERNLMTAAQLRYWSSQGIEVGAHGRTHRPLVGTAPAELRAELEGSRDDLAELLGVRPVAFAYPHGAYDDAAASLARELFPLSFTVEEGLATLRSDAAALPRTMVQPGDTLLDLAARAELGWSPLQRVRRHLGAVLAGAVMTRPRVVHLLGTAGWEGAGIARIVAALARHLPAYDIEAWFLGHHAPTASPLPLGASHSPLADELAQAGARVRFIPFAGVGDPVGALRLARALLATRPALIHQHIGGPSVRALLRMASRAPIVAHLHGGSDERGGPSPARVLARGADATIATSRAVAALVPDARARVVYPGVALRAACPDASTSSDAPRHGDERADRPRHAVDGIVLGFAGRLVPIKCVDVLLRAAATIPGVRIEIAGDGPERARLETLAPSARFLGWQADPTAAMRGWDVFVLPSRDEGFGIAALEAMALGLPVVASAVGGLPELVEHGRTGLLVPPGDPAALADALTTLARDPALRQRMGEAARARAAELTIERMVEGVASVYADLLDR